MKEVHSPFVPPAPADLRRTILVDGKPTELNVKPITLLCHPTGIKIDIPDRFEINAFNTIESMKKMNQVSWDLLRDGEFFKTLFNDVFPKDMKRFPGGIKIKLPKKIEDLNKCDLGVIHVCGMINPIMKAIYEKKEIFLKNPESHLHPREQAGLADMCIRLQGFKSS